MFVFKVVFLVKEERKNAAELTEFIHGDESETQAHDHSDPTLKGSRRFNF